MKRRNADCGKIRRPIKRNKIAEQIGSNTLLYVKFLLLWAFVITADFLLEFRFEFLWPFWLLLRSVYDSFKYKGLAFSVLFVCIAITSDLVCLFFIPVQWLFFAASTYVWVQYVWHTDKGICLPTIILWILFVYLEAAIRWKDSRNIPHLDLCRPFAAHCIGYPVVTLGFGFKSYVGYRIRQRKQREVSKDNDFYMQLLQEALPKDESTVNGESSSSVDQQQQQDHQLSPSVQQKELSVTAAAAAVQLQSSSSNSTSSNSSNSSGGGGGGHHHHHHSSKNAQSHNKSQSNVTSTSHANGHVGGGGSSTAGSNSASTSISGGNSTMNGGLNHSKHLHRKSLDKDSSGTPSGKANSYSYHQQQQQQSSTVCSNSAKESSRSNDSSHTNGAAMSPKEKKDCDSTGQKSHFDSLSSTSYHHTNSGSGSTNKSTQANEINHDSGGGGRSKGQQNGHVVNCDMELHSQQQVQQQNHIENDPPAEPKANRSGRKNRVKQKENANHLAAVRIAATLALASSITTLTTTAAAASSVSTSTAAAAATTTTTTSSTTTSMTSKDNHLHHHHSNHDQQQAEHHTAVSNSNSTVSNNTQNGSNSPTTGSTVIGPNAAPAVPPQPQVQPTVPPPVVPKVCDTCIRLEADAKKLRSEINALKQGEYEMRQKYDSNTGNLKNCLQVKQKEHDELQNKFQDLSTQRQQERQNMQTVERRLGEERRVRQSLESQLQNERKHRKQAEEKAARAECGEPCKLKRQQLEMEIQKLRRELINSEDAKHNAETQNRNFEQEMRKIEVQLRNRESQQSSEVLMSALAAMQDKNATLEKNLSAETRVKLDLFSALGDARRQLEIATCAVRTKEKEIMDLKAKMVQILAVMPGVAGESLCLSVPGGPSSSGGGLRLADAPQLLSQSALNGQPSPMSHIVMNSPPLISQLSQLGVLTSTITTPSAAMTGVEGAATNVVAGGAGMIPHSVHQQQQQQQQAAAGVVTVAAAVATGSNGQIVQMQNSNNCPSSLDPNASVYTPKNCSSSMVGGTEA